MSNQPDEFAIQPILPTPDIERLKSFYSEVFGAEEISRVPGKDGPFFVTLQLGTSSLTLVDYKKGAEAPPGRVTLAVFVQDVDELLARVKPAGGKAGGKARNMQWGQRVAHISDPDGNPINLTQQL